MNTAGRLLDILNKLRGNSLARSTPMVQVWGNVLDLPDSPNLEDEVAACLQALRAELDLLREQLQLSGVPENLMHPGWSRLRNLASVAQLNTSWESYRDEILKPEVLLAYKWANWALRDQAEEDVPAEEMAALGVELESLEQALKSTDMTPWLRGFVQRQIAAIRTALRLYRLQGVKPVEEALQKVAGAYAIEKARVAAEHAKASDEAKGVLERTGQAIEKTAKFADAADKIRKAAEGYVGLAANVAPLVLGYVQRLL